jgi:hypothetical protein
MNIGGSHFYRRLLFFVVFPDDFVDMCLNLPEKGRSIRYKMPKIQDFGRIGYACGQAGSKQAYPPIDF